MASSPASRLNGPAHHPNCYLHPWRQIHQSCWSSSDSSPCSINCSRSFNHKLDREAQLRHHHHRSTTELSPIPTP
ncbi:hypothetical protein M0R45_004744 [Rubus argutus]|uniref:Uncharacterized protein n=1 Tax=Rubus argutus TaxID=59490 RepID=A0AAW1YKR4_RUBAR